ncbi:hypothetical protein JD969_12890 [Planctomycetota bacterium]|nr:hypothetical protein JD969_12890 [Planctomycetota bacterium]
MITNLILYCAYSLGIWIAVAYLLWIARKSQLVWSKPLCGRCGYDLRSQIKGGVVMGACPECGCMLGGKKQVHYVRGQFSIRHTALALSPLLLWAMMWAANNVYATYYLPNVHTKKRLQTKAVNRVSYLKQLEAANTQSEIWSSVYKELSTGGFDKAQKDAITKKIRKCAFQEGMGDVSPSFKRCLQYAKFDQEMSDEEAVALAKKFYGETLRIKPGVFSERLYSGDEQVRLDVSCEDRDALKLLGIDDLVHIKAVHLNDVHAEIDINPRISEIDIYWSGNIIPGEHWFTFYYERAFVRGEYDFDEEDDREQWPDDFLYYEEGEIKYPIWVYKKASEAIRLVNDSEITKKLHEQLKVTYCVVRNVQGKRYLYVRLSPSDKTIIDDMQISYGISYWAKNDLNQTIGSVNKPIKLKDWMSGFEHELPPDWDYDTVNLKISPDFKNVSSDEDVEEIWGGEIVLKQIPVTRYDRLIYE